MSKSSTTDLEKKLGKYSALAGALVASVGAADAQVMYTDLNPDEVVSGTGSQYLLDLNNDGTDDFDFFTVVQTGTYGGGLVNYTIDGVGINPLNSNEAIGTAGTYITYAKALNGGDTVNDAGVFMSGGTGGLLVGAWAVTTGLLSTQAPVGNFANTTDKYFGLKLVSGGMTYYGWARVDMTADGTAAPELTIKDYAYEATADQEIITAFNVGVDEQGLQGVAITQVGDKVIIDVDQSHAGQGQMIITSLNGQEVQSQNLQAGMKVVHTENLASGVYMITARFAEGQITKKIMVR